jgi:hypothetical protein
VLIHSCVKCFEVPTPKFRKLPVSFARFAYAQTFVIFDRGDRDFSFHPEPSLAHLSRSQILR